MKLSGSRVVVTGAASGLGRAIAVDLASRGAAVTAVDVQAGAQAPPGVTAVEADLLRADDRRRVVEVAGGVDVLVNNVGLAPIGPLVGLSTEEIERAVGLNVVATIDLSRLVLPGMLARRRGHIVNIGSINAWLPLPPVTLYSATKAAVEAFSDGLRRETLGRGVDVTLVAPGPIRDTAGLTAAGDEVPPAFARLHGVLAVPASWVAAGVRLAIEHPGWPGTRTLAVPPAAAVTWLATVPGIDRLVDLGVAHLRDRMGLA